MNVKRRLFDTGPIGRAMGVRNATLAMPETFRHHMVLRTRDRSSIQKSSDDAYILYTKKKIKGRPGGNMYPTVKKNYPKVSGTYEVSRSRVPARTTMYDIWSST